MIITLKFSGAKNWKLFNPLNLNLHTIAVNGRFPLRQNDLDEKLVHFSVHFATAWHSQNSKIHESSSFTTAWIVILIKFYILKLKWYWLCWIDLTMIQTLKAGQNKFKELTWKTKNFSAYAYSDSAETKQQ